MANLEIDLASVRLRLFIKNETKLLRNREETQLTRTTTIKSSTFYDIVIFARNISK